MARGLELRQARRRDGIALCASCSNTAMCLKFPSESIRLCACIHDVNGYVWPVSLKRWERDLGTTHRQR